jgi:hypothetical protein
MENGRVRSFCGKEPVNLPAHIGARSSVHRCAEDEGTDWTMPWLGRVQPNIVAITSADPFSRQGDERETCSWAGGCAAQ